MPETPVPESLDAAAALPGIAPVGGFSFRGGQVAFLAKLADAFRRGDTHHLGVFVPGYGKTITALAAFLVARATGVARRVVVFVPRGNLRDQYADGEALARLFADLGAPPMTFCVADSARAFAKNPRTDLLVTTYQYASGRGGHARAQALLRHRRGRRWRRDVRLRRGPPPLRRRHVGAHDRRALAQRVRLALGHADAVATTRRSSACPSRRASPSAATKERVYVALHEVTLRDAHAEGGILKHVEAHVVDYRLRMVREDTGETVETLSPACARWPRTAARSTPSSRERSCASTTSTSTRSCAPPSPGSRPSARPSPPRCARSGEPPGSYDDHRMLVIAMSNAHSAAILAYMQRTFPHFRSARIGQDVPAADCARDLDDYREGGLDVMVQVDMIGEGTDIKPISVDRQGRPRARRSPKRSSRSSAGCATRRRGPRGEHCDLYAANDSDVVAVLDWITAEERIGIRQKKQRSARAAGRGRLGADEEPLGTGARGAPPDAVARPRHGGDGGGRHGAPRPAARQARPAALDVSAREQALRKACADLANELVRRSPPRNDVSARAVHARAKQGVGARQADLSLPQLDQKRRWLERCMQARRLL